MRFDHVFLRLFAGPLVWAAHFLVIYGFAGVACARGLRDAGWLGIGVTAWVIGVATVLAVAAVFLLSVRPGYTNMPHDSVGFSRWAGAALGMFSIVAIVWEAVPVLMLPACA